MRPHPASRARVRQTGFGLLEAIVALTLFSLTGVVLFSWINLSLSALARAEEQVRMSQRDETALAALSELDLFEQRDGEIPLEPDWQLHWEAKPLTPRQTTAPLPGGSRGGHEVQLFRIDATLEPSAGGPATSLQLTRLMYR